MKTTTKKDLMYEQIRKHGENLLSLFPDTKFTDAVKLSKALYRLENRYHREAEAFCNGGIDIDVWGIIQDEAELAVKHITGNTDIPIIINGDARGYTLKIDSDYMYANNVKLHRDWGGYGILAPDLTVI